MAQKIEITPGRARLLNAAYKRLRGANPAQAAAELAVLMRKYGLKKWEGRSLGGLDMQANSVACVGVAEYDASHWHGPSDQPNRRMSRFTTGQRVHSLYTPSGQQILLVRSHSASSVPMATAPRPAPYRRPFSVGYGTIVEAHTHRLPFDVALERGLWWGCCKRPEEYDISKFADIVMLLAENAPLAKIAAVLFSFWEDIHGRATLVELG